MKNEYVSLNRLVPQELELLSEGAGISSNLEPSNLTKWRELKAERNSLLAFVAAVSMNHTMVSRQDRPPFGLVRQNDRNGRITPVVSLNINHPSEDQDQDFASRMIGLKLDLGFTLKHDLREIINHMRIASPRTYERRIYDRAKVMTIGFWQSGERNTRSGDTVFLFSSRAIDSALNVMTRLSFTARELFMKKFETEPTMPELGEIIGNSQDTFVEFATMHLSLFNRVIDSITPENQRIFSFLSYYFLLESNHNKSAININSENLKELVGSFNLELNSDTTYCPALASAALTHRNLGLAKPEYKTPIHGLVAWYADLLRAA